jgi:hypothetical protein
MVWVVRVVVVGGGVVVVVEGGWCVALIAVRGSIAPPSPVIPPVPVVPQHTRHAPALTCKGGGAGKGRGVVAIQGMLVLVNQM